MAVNLSRRNDAYLYSSDRIAQVMGSGQLTFIDRATGLGLFFAEEEAGFYSTEDELIDKLRFYSEHDLERQEIGRAGWKKYRTLFNSTRIASYMVDVVYGLIDPAEFRWNTSETTTV
jgi:spore maturation protein CgeB